MKMSNGMTIRAMCLSDAEYFASEERAQGWLGASADKYTDRLAEAEAGWCDAMVCELDGVPAGYVSVFWSHRGGAMAEFGWPEIVDLGVLEKFRHKGVGSFLMEKAEETAARRSDTVRIGVGLHAGYGSAQRMYVRRGYMPDGSGVWYGDKVCEPYSPCVNDDDLVLYLYKKLK